MPANLRRATSNAWTSPIRRRRRWIVAATIGAAIALVALSRERRVLRANDAPEFTIYVLGGSTALGEPYSPKANFGNIVAYLFDGELGGRKIAVTNLGRAGQSAADALPDAQRIAGAHPPSGAAVVLFYPGNNEFLRFDTAPDLVHPERSRLEVSTVTEAEGAQVTSAYGQTLDQIFVTLQGADIPVVVSTAAVNLKDWEPNRSVAADAAHLERVRGLLESASEAAARADYRAALVDVEAALDLEPNYALASFRAGQYAYATEQFAVARGYFQDAIDHDGNRHRETSTLTATLRRTAGARGVPIVDAAAILSAASAGNIPGYEVFWDNCHPTLQGYTMIAEAFANEIERLFGVRRARAHAEPRALEEALEIDGPFIQQVYNKCGQYCYGTSAVTRNPGPRLDRAEEYLERASSYGDDASVSCSRAVLAALRGDRPASLSHWRRAWTLDAETTRARMSTWQVEAIMKRIGVEDLSSQVEPPDGF